MNLLIDLIKVVSDNPGAGAFVIICALIGLSLIVSVIPRAIWAWRAPEFESEDSEKSEVLDERSR